MSAEPVPSVDHPSAAPWDAAARAALDALPIVAFIARDNGGIVWASRRWYEITGTSRERNINEAWLEAIAPDDRDVALERWERARATGERYELTVRARMHDDSYRWFLSSAERMAQTGPAGEAWFGTAIEVTAQRTADLAIAKSEREYRALADAMPQIVWASTGEANDYLNAQWFRYTGIDASEGSQIGWWSALHPDDVGSTFAHWKRCVASGEPFETEYRLRGADGAYRWFLGRGTPLLDDRGEAVKWFGTCTDIDDFRRRERAERFVSDAIALLARSREGKESCKLVTTRAVETIATYCVVDLLRDNGRFERIAWSHADPRREIELAEVVNYPPSIDRPESPVARALGPERATFVPHFDDEWRRKTAIDADHEAFLRKMRTTSIISVPLEAYGRDIGAITFCLADTDETYNQVDVLAFGDVGRRLGSAIESARVSQHDRTVAERFQRAALPQSLPSVAGIAFDAVYHAAAGDEEVGGDWYDVVVMPPGGVLLSLGDVAGHDLDAAIGMIGVRQSIRSAALFGHGPRDVLETVNASMLAENGARYATAFVAVLDPGSGRLRYASAGHPPALVRRANGSIEALAGDAPPLGLFDATGEFVEGEVVLAPGDVLVAYTDGLIDSDRDLISGEVELHAAVASDAFAHVSSPAIHLRDRMLRAPARDDVAILVVGFRQPERWSFGTGDAMAAQGARVSFSRYLERTCTPESDMIGSEIIFGELLGNVARHAPGPVEIALEWRGDRAMLHVYDHGSGLAWAGPSLPDTFAEGGRGLFIVSQLARACVVEAQAARGTHVAVELPVERRATPRVSE